jgi:hypothetical protein
VNLRTIHIGASFAIVVVAYGLYGLLAVPWIEPPPPPPSTTSAGGGSSFLPRPNELEQLFDEHSWERGDDANCINSNGQALLLWRKYRTQSDGWVDLTPLTIIFMPDETVVDQAERLRHAVVMQVPEGANLRFDQPLDLKKGGIGRLIQGRLRGPVKISSQGKRPDHQDDLLVLTHDVDLTEQRITTASDVDFRWGLNSGRGRKMEIKLLPRLGPHVADQQGPNIGGIEEFQLEHVERLHLDMGSASAASSQGKAPPSQPPGSPMPGTLAAHAAPVEITCRGPFRFRLVEQEPVATFRDQVDVLRIQPNGPCDHMSCELLSIFFTRPDPRPDAASTAKKSASGFDLQPARIVAQGTPTTLNSPVEHVQARAERLEYNVIDGQIVLADTQEVMLLKDASEIHGPSLKYTPGPADHPRQFRLYAGGPGWLRGEMGPGQQLEARWRQELNVQPQDQNQVISLLGGATLKFQAMGMSQLDAKDIHFWLHETPPDVAGQTHIEPDRLLAEGNVVGNSPQFSMKDVQRLEVWFAKAPLVPSVVAAAGVAAANSPAPYIPSTGGGPALVQGQTGTPMSAAAPPPASPLIPLAGQDTAAGGRQSHLEISGRLLQACLLMRDQQHGELSEVTVTDNLKLQETQTALPTDLPLLVTGQWLHVTQASSPQAKIAVRGKPAHMEGRGMSLTGPSIDIDRGANTLIMDGAGWMERLLDRDLENRPLTQMEMVKIDWKKGMTFDGRKAHFQDQINVTGTAKLLRTGWLDVTFQHTISLSDTRPQQPSAVAGLICGDGVYIENRSQEAGQQSSYDRMWLKRLELNNITGDIQGQGPGRLISVRRGSGQEFAMPGSPLTGSGRAAAARPVSLGPTQSSPSDPNRLTCIDLKFMKGLTGNKNNKDVVFHRLDHANYAPVQSWTAALDGDDPNQFGPQAIVMHCDSLEITDMSPTLGSTGNGELIALDNVTAEGTNFNTRSARLTYTQAKDMLTLEGDGRSLAELFQQEGPPGTPFRRTAAQKFSYLVKTGLVLLNGVQSAESNQVPGRSMNPGRK